MHCLRAFEPGQPSASRPATGQTAGGTATSSPRGRHPVQTPIQRLSDEPSEQPSRFISR